MSPSAINQALTLLPETTVLGLRGESIPANQELALTRSQQIRLIASRPAGAWRWKRLAWPAAGILAAVLGVAYFQPLKALQSEPVPTPAEHESPAKIVSVVLPQPATTASVVLPATIRPWQTATLYSRVTGYLTTWNVDLGARVKAGELLAELETPELDQEVAEGESQAQEASAVAVQAQAERTEAEAELNVTVAQLARVRAEMELAKSQFTRRKKLLASQAITHEEYDTFQRQWEAKTADLAAAEADVARRRSNLQTRAAIIEARQATAKSRRANVDRLKELQGFKRIVAPFDGVVTRRNAEVGMLATTGTDALFEIQDMSRVRVQVNVPQANSAQVGVGVEAVVSLPESAAKHVRATVTRVADAVDSMTRTMLAEIELNNAAHGFQPGSYVQVTMTTPQNSTAWTIPTNTLQMQVAGPHVAVVGSDSQVELRHVTLGRNLGNRVVVIEGIRGTERLIVNPGDSLANGSRVEVD